MKILSKVWVIKLFRKPKFLAKITIFIVFCDVVYAEVGFGKANFDC